MEEKSYVIFDHFDEYNTNGYTHLIRIDTYGTLNDIFTVTQDTEQQNRSEVSKIKLTEDQFPDWFDWFTKELADEETYLLQLSLSAEGIAPLLSKMDEDYQVIE